MDASPPEDRDQVTPELTPEKLSKACDQQAFEFETTADLLPELKIIGQPRGTAAIDFGINMASPGYNVYVLGESGTGRTTAIRQFIQDKAGVSPVPNDCLYIFNFKEPHKPDAITLPPGMGRSLEKDIDAALESLVKQVPALFESKVYRDAALEIQHHWRAL
jgi:hypothetical protein